MVYRKGELTGRAIDSGWPHQVALPADRVVGANYNITHDFCRDLSLCSRGHCVQHKGTQYVVFCFADPTHADLFRERFGGERFDSNDRGRGSNWHQWRKR